MFINLFTERLKAEKEVDEQLMQAEMKPINKAGKTIKKD